MLSSNLAFCSSNISTALQHTEFSSTTIIRKDMASQASNGNNKMEQPGDTSHVENRGTSTGVMDLEDGFKPDHAEPITWTPDEERRAVRKLDWCLIPL